MDLQPDKFWSKVEKGDGCWVWLGAVDKKGYGYVQLRESPVRTVRLSAHRLAWEFTHGPISHPALVVRHYKCDNRRCCNPTHLRLGTHQDNMDDMVRAGRSLTGERAPSSKLSTAAVAEARRLSAAGWSATDIARRFGVHQTTISRLLGRKTWR